MELALFEVTVVGVTIELKFAFSSFLTIHKVTSILNLVIFPLLGTLSMVLVIEPLSIVHRPILVDKHAHSAGFTLLPFSVINISIFMRNSSLTMEETFVRHALIRGTIRELDKAKSLPRGFVLVNLPLTLILSTLANVSEECVPEVSFPSFMRVKPIFKLRIREKRLLRSDQLSFEVKWLLLPGDCQGLDQFLEPASGNGARSPSLDGIGILD